jgi:hypothetical protein
MREFALGAPPPASLKPETSRRRVGPSGGHSPGWRPIGHSTDNRDYPYYVKVLGHESVLLPPSGAVVRLIPVVARAPR